MCNFYHYHYFMEPLNPGGGGQKRHSKWKNALNIHSDLDDKWIQVILYLFFNRGAHKKIIKSKLDNKWIQVQKIPSRTAVNTKERFLRATMTL